MLRLARYFMEPVYYRRLNRDIFAFLVHGTNLSVLVSAIYYCKTRSSTDVVSFVYEETSDEGLLGK